MLDSLGVERYQMLRLVGRGGMGELYEVWDTRLERRVAVKRLHPHVMQRPDSGDLVLREARAAAKVEHPNVVRVYGVEQAGNELLIEMQYIEGRPLHSLFYSGPLPAALAVDLLEQSLEGLAACHERGVIHCDLKPANMLVNAGGTVFLSDFGIARALPNPLQMAGREDESVPNGGTPRYSPPEAWNGGSPTVAWDLYSIGVVMYEALSGASPFRGDTLTEIRSAVFAGPVCRVAELRGDLSPAFTGLIDELIAADPARRPASAKAALARLKATPEYRERTEETVGKVSPAFPLPVAQSTKKKSALRWLIAGAMFAGALLALFFGWRNARSPQAPAPPPLTASTAPIPTDVPVSIPPKLEPPAPGPPVSFTDLLPEPRDLSVFNGTLYFGWDDGVHGEELWGIPKGGTPQMIEDLNPGSEGSHPHSFYSLGNRIAFGATTPESGEELWIMMASEGKKFFKPRLVLDIIPHEMGSAPLLLASRENLLLFLATTMNEGRELWLTNGNEKQTGRVRDVNPGAPDAALNRSHFWPDDTGAYWCARTNNKGEISLLRYSYRKNDLEVIRVLHADVHDLAVFQGKAFFRENGGDGTGEELWTYDPETKVCAMLKDISPGEFSSYPDKFFSWNSKNLLMFQAQLEGEGHELWRTDGTPEGTQLVKNIYPGPKDSDPDVYVDMGDELVFRAWDEADGYELWVTDGTGEGTHLLQDMNPGSASFKPYNTVRVGERLFFSGDDGTNGDELWVAEHEGKKWSARIVEDYCPGFWGSYPHFTTALDDHTVIFSASRVLMDMWIHKLTIDDAGKITITELPRAGS